MPTLTIATTVTIPKGAEVPAISRTIDVASACPTTVTVPEKSWTPLQLRGGPRELLKLFILNPAVQTEKKTGTMEKAASGPAGAPAPAEDPLAGCWFSTDDGDGEGQSSGEIPLTGAQIYMDTMLDSLYGPNQKELDQITFYNPTNKCIDVTIIVGRDFVSKETGDPCASGAAAGMAAGAAKKPS